MTPPDLLLHLKELEERLFELQIRTSRKKLEELLSPDFIEIGRSGQFYSYDQIVDALLAENAAGTVTGRDYELRMLSDKIALLTYQTMRTADDAGLLSTLRSSIWRKEADGNWRMVFHQGTPLPLGTGASA